MKPNLLGASLFTLALCAPALHVAALQVSPVSTNEAAGWARHTVPLPREIRVAARVLAEPAEVALNNHCPASPAADRAAAELRQTLRLANADAAPVKPGFTITLEVGGPEAEPLRGLKNADQASRIFPAPADKGLHLVALTPRGIYYAAKTLQQLVRTQANSPRLEIPLLTMRDWPAMEDRGLWGVDAYDCLEWLADRKLNYVEQITGGHVDPITKRGTAKPKPGHEALLDLAPELSIEFVPVVLHLEQLENRGLFEAFPNLRAKNAGKPGAICYSRPEFVPVLADWLVDLARLPHVNEVDVWLAENLRGKGGCKCDQCSQTDRSVLETRAVLAAWREAQKRAGKFGLRILTSEETYPSHKLVFAEIPPDVKVWYYHSLLTYTAMKKPMVTGEVAKLAASGHWLGICPSLVAHVGFPEPFSSAQFVQRRIQEFLQHKLGGIIGYPSPRVRYARFNVEAMAEWTWNPEGRTPHEFALSWAVRDGIRDPEKFADWMDLHGKVAWDVYGSDWPAGERRRTPGPVSELLAQGKLPALGEAKWGLYSAPWGDFKAAEQLDADVIAAARASKLAHELDAPEFLQETLVVQGYIDSLKALYELKQLGQNGRIPSEKRTAAEQQFKVYTQALEQSLKALPAWELTLPGRADGEPLVKEPVQTIQQMIKQMRATATSMVKPSK